MIFSTIRLPLRRIVLGARSPAVPYPFSPRSDSMAQVLRPGHRRHGEMSVHTKPRWLERVARAVVTPEAAPEAARSKPGEEAGSRHGPAWPLVLVALGL